MWRDDSNDRRSDGGAAVGIAAYFFGSLPTAGQSRVVVKSHGLIGGLPVKQLPLSIFTVF